MYALSDVGQKKTAGDGTHFKNGGKLKFEDKLPNKSLGLYV